MVDWLEAVLTGFFTGVGVATANWFHERHIRDKLDRLSGHKKKEDNELNSS